MTFGRERLEGREKKITKNDEEEEDVTFGKENEWKE